MCAPRYFSGLTPEGIAAAPGGDYGIDSDLRLDDAGRIWAAAHDGLRCFDPDRPLRGKLRFPEIVANFTFGGPEMSGRQSRRRLPGITPGAPARGPGG